MPLSRQDEQAAARRPILVTQGEPSGIGPEIALKSWIRLGGEIAGRPIFLSGSLPHFRETAARLAFDIARVERSIIDTGAVVQAEPGRPSPRNASSVTAAIEQSVAACMDRRAAAVVTAPIQKSALAEALSLGRPFHTASITARIDIVTGRMSLVFTR